MFDKLAGIILRNASEKTYAAMWEEEAADVEHMTTGQREVLEEAATEAMPEEAATEAVPEERQQSEEPKVRESLIEHVEKLVEQQEFQEEIEKYIPPKTRTYEKIQRQDIARLPRTQWHLANNSFLLHGFYNYHHLLYIEEGENRWIDLLVRHAHVSPLLQPHSPLPPARLLFYAASAPAFSILRFLSPPASALEFSSRRIQQIRYPPQ